MKTLVAKPAFRARISLNQVGLHLNCLEFGMLEPCPLGTFGRY